MMVDRINTTNNNNNPQLYHHEEQHRRVLVVANPIDGDDEAGAATTRKVPSTSRTPSGTNRGRSSSPTRRKSGGTGNGSDKTSGPSHRAAGRRNDSNDNDDADEKGERPHQEKPPHSSAHSAPKISGGTGRTKRRDSDHINNNNKPLPSTSVVTSTVKKEEPAVVPAPPKSPRSHKTSSSRRRSSSPVPSSDRISSSTSQRDTDRRRHSSKDRLPVPHSDEPVEATGSGHGGARPNDKGRPRKPAAASHAASTKSPGSPLGRSRPKLGKEPKSPRQQPPPPSPGNRQPSPQQNLKSSRGRMAAASSSLSPSRPRRTRSHREGHDEVEPDELPPPGPLGGTRGSAPPPPPPLSPRSRTKKTSSSHDRPGPRCRSGPDESRNRHDQPLPAPQSPGRTPAAPMMSHLVADLVDIVAQEPPDYSEFYASPRRRTSAGAGAGEVAPSEPCKPPATATANTGAVPTTTAHPPKALPGEAAAPTPTTDKATQPAVAATNPLRAPTAAALTADPKPSKPTATTTTTTRVTNTRSRMHGVMGTLQWVIHIDTPGGHAGARLQLVTAVELWDDEVEETYYVENAASARDPQTTSAVAKAAPAATAAWCENSINPTGDDEFHDDDSSLDTQRLHESVINFMQKLEKSRPGPVAEGFDDSIIDYAHSSHHTSASQARDMSQPLKASGHSQPSKLPPSTHSSSHKGAASDRRPSQPQRHVSHASMWNSNRLVEPQVHAPPPPPPTKEPQQQPRIPSNGSIPSDSVTTSSSSRLLSQYEQQQQVPVQAHQLVLTPSDHFVPRVMNIQGMVLLNDTMYRVERENSKDSRTFADTVGDDTIENSCDMPDMWQIDEFEKSQTWGQANDFSASDVGDDDEETLENPFSPCGKSVDTNVVDEYDDEDDDVSEYQKNRAAGYLTNYGYVGTPGSAMVLNGSLSRGSSAQSADEGSIDPSKGFLPRGSKASMLTDASDSLADIQDSFACDSGVEEFQHSQITEKRRNQIKAGMGQDSQSNNYASTSQSMYSQSLSSLPEDRVLNEGHVASGHGAYTNNAPGGMRRTIGILGGGAAPGLKRSPESQSSMGARNVDASRLSATQHRPAQRPMALRQRSQVTSKLMPSPSSSSNSDASVPKLASQFADSFLGPATCPSSTLKNAGFTTCSENDAQALHSAKLALQRSMNSLSTGSDSSTSVHSFGIPGLRASHQSDMKTFVQFNLTAADGVKVIHNESDVNSGRNNRTLPKGSLTVTKRVVAGQPMNNKSEHDQSIDEFNVNSMPHLVDMEAPANDAAPARRLPGRGISLLGSRRAGSKKPEPANAESTTPSKTPKASNRRFLRREKSSNVPREDPALASRSSHHDIVKRFFTLANSSFGSLGPPSEFLDDEDTNNDDDFRY